MALSPIAHPHTWGVKDVAGGKITDDVIQSFGDAHGETGQHWLAANLVFSEIEMSAILTIKDTLAANLRKTVMTRMIRSRPV